MIGLLLTCCVMSGYDRINLFMFIIGPYVSLRINSSIHCRINLSNCIFGPSGMERPPGGRNELRPYERVVLPIIPVEDGVHWDSCCWFEVGSSKGVGYGYERCLRDS